MKSLSHTPVLVEELLSLFDPAKEKDLENLHILDCTFGRGGHSFSFLNKYPNSSVLALDRDLTALQSIDPSSIKPTLSTSALSNPTTSTLSDPKTSALSNPTTSILSNPTTSALSNPKTSVLLNPMASTLLSQTISSQKCPSRFKLLHHNFHDFPNQLEQALSFDLILMDLGVSSPQLDTADRGFSFNKPGPLDMRMDQTQKLKADDILNHFSKKELIELFQNYGEIRRPYLVVNELIQKRKKKKLERTEEFVEIIQKYHSSFKYKHAATQWFLALRIAVNQELEGLKKALPLYLPLLKPGAFFAVISFHSLEDRIVKQSFRHFVNTKQGHLYNKKVLRASRQERENNRRSRSAKLRVFQKNLS